MAVDTHLLAALKENGYEGEEDKAAEHLASLGDDDKASVMDLARDNRSQDRLFDRLIGQDDKPGALRNLMTSTLDAHTTAMEDRINKVVQQRLDNAGIKPNIGSDAHKEKKNGKADDAPVPDNFVPVAQFDKLKSDLELKDIEQDITAALNEESLMPNAFGIALRELKEKAEKKDGKVTVKMKDGDGILRSMSSSDAVSALRVQNKFLFKAPNAGGTGGGGDDVPGKDPNAKPLKRVTSYGVLLQDPNLLYRYMEEAPEELKKLEDAHSAGDNGELARLMQGDGLDPRSLVERQLASLKSKVVQG